MPLHKRQGAEIFYGWIRPCGVFYLVQIAISQARRLGLIGLHNATSKHISNLIPMAMGLSARIRPIMQHGFYFF